MDYSHGENDRLLTPREAGELMRVSPGSLANWRYEGRGPVFIRLGDGPKPPIRYRLSDVRRFIHGEDGDR